MSPEMCDINSRVTQHWFAGPISRITHRILHRKTVSPTRLLLITIPLLVILLGTSRASEWGGHVRGRGAVLRPDAGSIYRSVDTGPHYDGSGEFRLKNKIFLEQWGYFETHYEAVLWGGDTWRAHKLLEELYPDLFSVFAAPPDDTLRLMDLTGIVDETDDYVLYHRLDRLSMTLQLEWGTVCMGRQVLTWGNGLLFNPMDLFNPFAPTDIERDYKIGDDMVTTQFRANNIGGLQFVYVPRRDPESHDVAWDQSSVAGKWHFAAGTTEFDIMGAKHYKNFVVGIGSTGYLGDAAWRADATCTFADEESAEDDFRSLVANIDYSWVWWGKNLYGLVEFYFNGLGTDDYEEAYANPEMVKRLARGEVFTLGRTHLAGSVQVEWHPLFTVYLTVISNLADPSGVIQPRAIWDVTQNLQMTFGSTLYYGGTGTEYGGFEIPDTSLLTKPRDSAFVWLSYFF